MNTLTLSKIILLGGGQICFMTKHIKASDVIVDRILSGEIEVFSPWGPDSISDVQMNLSDGTLSVALTPKETFNEEDCSEASTLGEKCGWTHQI